MRFVVLSILFISLISGCSSRLAYNNLDWLIPWYLDDYIEFEGEQESAVKAKLVDTLNWHRQQQLPIYIQDIQALSQEIEKGALGQQRWLQIIEHVYGYWLTIRDQFVDDLVVLSPQLNQNQVDQLFVELEERNQEREEEWADTTAEERKEMRLERLTEQIEDFLGDLNETQMDMVKQAVDQMRGTTQVRLNYLRDYQKELKSVFKTAETDQARINQLARILKQTDAYKSQDYLDILQHNRQVIAQLFSDLQISLSEKQKRQLLSELADLKQDLEELQQG